MDAIKQGSVNPLESMEEITSIVSTVPHGLATVTPSSFFLHDDNGASSSASTGGGIAASCATCWLHECRLGLRHRTGGCAQLRGFHVHDVLRQAPIASAAGRTTASRQPASGS